MAGCVHNTDPRTQTTFYVVEPIIDLSHVLDLTVTSEGVQTARELSEIVELGADHAQEFDFSPAKRLQLTHYVASGCNPAPLVLQPQLC